MQTCSKCNALSHDSAFFCHNCNSDLREFSTTAVALKRMQANDRVQYIILQVWDDACPACRKVQGAHPKDQVPKLPVEGCSHARGCRCFYQPVLSEIYP